MPSLFVIQGKDQGKRFELNEPHIALGRDLTNEIQLHDTEVSRRHASISRQDDGGYSFLDLSSSNGSFVNNQQVQTRHLLRSGDRIQIGRTLMIYTGQEGSSESNATEAVDIIAHDPDGQESRIIRSMGQQESGQDAPDAPHHESAWLARARSNLQVMYRTALAASHTMDITQLLDRIMELIFEWVEADRGCIMLVCQETDELVPKVSHHRHAKRADEKISISSTILDFVMTKREGVLTSDAQEDQRWDAAASIVKMGVREAIAVPMQGRYGIVGVIYIDTYTPPGRAIYEGSSNRFSDEHLKLMIAIGHQAALAVEDTSYYSAMVQAERLAAIGQTIAGLSHHIKNILQGIRGGSYLIEEGLKHSQTEMLRKGWDIVEKNQERISNLVMDMLSFSKEREPDLVPSDLNQIVGDVVELMQSRAKETGTKLSWTSDDAIPTMLFDPEALHRAVLNVVSNALDACDQIQKSEIRVLVRHDHEREMLQVVVEDNGRGIEPEDRKRIFQVFESRKGSRGTGLGLPVSQKIMKEHGGDIRVRSTPGSGSQFILEFPANAPAKSGETLVNLNSDKQYISQQLSPDETRSGPEHASDE